MKPTERDLRIAQILAIELNEPETQANIFRLASIRVESKLIEENRNLRSRVYDTEGNNLTLDATVRGLLKRQEWLEQFRP